MSSPRVVFVIGDSISLHYGPYLRRLLPGNWTYDRKGGADPDAADLDSPQEANGGDSDQVVTYLKARCGGDDFRPDLLLLNCGLHDIKHADESGPCQVPVRRYRQNLESILMLCKARGLPILWVRSTPVDDDRHRYHQKSFFRFAQDLAEYNATADRVMGEYQVPIVDLHGFTLALGEKPLYVDHVHFTEPVRRLQAAHLAGAMAAWGHFLDRRRSSCVEGTAGFQAR